MRIASTRMRISKEEPYQEREQESVFSAKENGKEVIDKWVKWFQKELLEALEKGEDVDILLGRKPSTNGEYVR